MNVGAVCRAMKTMGLSKLAFAAPSEMNTDKVKQMALHAFDIYENAEFYSTLEEALEGTVFSAGITRRRGARRKWFSILPEELAVKVSLIESGISALVFGNEQTGLTDNELNLCNTAVHIPSSPDFPSLNLSHAVQIITYTLYRQFLEGKTGGYIPVEREKIDRLVTVIHNSLDSMNYFKAADRFHTDRYFRDIFSRAMLSKKEADQMEKIFKKLQYIKDK
jgi:TrmH family RNA methyltransferase